MTRKRRVFDIHMPDDVVETAVQTPEQPADRPRRGPMASAIVENAEALQARKSAAEAIRDENDALAHEYVELREAGQVVVAVPLDQVHAQMLVRDRLQREDPELIDLVTSIRDVGLSNPIRVLPRPDGDGYELVQGFRRLTAYRQLLDETGDAAWSQVPALVMAGAEGDIGGLYRRMVDENIIRKDLSFAEMAFAATTYAADPGTEAQDLDAALLALFQSAPRSKRSYIRLFALVLEQLGDRLAYPTEIPRALGVSLGRVMKERPEVAGQIRDALAGWDNRSVSDELEVLRRHAGTEDATTPEAGPASSPAKPRPAGQGARTKTTFHIRSSAGQVKCTAGPGRLEIKVDRDFSSIDRARLERAIASLIDGLG